MKQKKKNIRIVFVVLLAVLCAFPINSFAGTKWDHLAGIPKKDKSVSVEVKTYVKPENGNLRVLSDLTRIKAGDDTSYIPVIKNTGNTSNLRIRLYAKAGDDSVNILKYCYGYEGNWQKKDGWFYLKEPFKSGEEYRICEGFHFPKDWKWQNNNLLDVTIEAEAVQDESFKTNVSTGDNKNMTYILLFSFVFVVIVAGVSIQKLLAQREAKKNGKKDL